MCGIAGSFSPIPASNEGAFRQRLQVMSDLIVHRGPDASGIWVSSDGRMGLAHRRLAVLDVSDAGQQPMASADDRFVIVFNGEIYNHLDLRKELDANEPIEWRSHADTETLLEAITRWGLPDTLRRAYGMFALAVYDSQNHTLALARDRMGEKPLYFGHVQNGWIFASELPALNAGSEEAPSLDFQVVAAQLASGVVPDDACILTGIHKVRPGSIVTFVLGADAPHEETFEDFLSLMTAGHTAAPMYRNETAGAAADRVETVLQEVVASQMLSDVPLGCFLSGGIDSSLIAALMQRGSQRAVQTFSIGFEDMGYDESRHAETVAQHLGTNHRSFVLREDDALELIPNLARIYGEPFADSSQVPTLLLCREARKHVAVALTGDGGDEIFGGYNRHILAPRIWSVAAHLPPILRRCLPFVGRQLVKSIGSPERRKAGSFGFSASVLAKVARFGEVAGSSRSLDDIYWGLTRQCDNPEQLMQNRTPPLTSQYLPAFDLLHPSERMMALDSVGYLPSDILVKVDRAAMSASLETRTPFLDARVVQAAWSLDLEHRIRRRVGKAVLRDILDRYVPRKLVERPKQGFAVPIDAWLRGPLQAWAARLLTVERLEAGGVLDSANVRAVWDAHVSGKKNNGQLLWSILMLQQWLDEWGRNIVIQPATNSNLVGCKT